MYLGYSLSLVIPCLNEEHAIKKVLKNIPSYVDEIIVVDNDSTDNTALVAKKYGAKVILEKKKGYGAALQTGIYKARKQLICTIDGDGTYDAKSIRSLIRHMHINKLHFVSGNRFNSEYFNSIHVINLVGNKILTRVTNILYNKHICDSQSGMMIFKKNILPKLHLKCSGMSFSEEIKIETISHKDLFFGEYPIVYRGKQRIGKKKLRLWRDGFENLSFLFIKRFKG